MKLADSLERMALFALVFVIIICISSTLSQDPSDGWLGYAKAEHPASVNNNQLITKLEAYWINLDAPKVSNALFAPWVGIGTSDHLNRIQSVNPWIAKEWQIYNEYYQYSPKRNKNSHSHVSYPNDIIHSLIEYHPLERFYEVFVSDLTQDWSVKTRVEVQAINRTEEEYKKYTFAYFAFWTQNVSMDCSLYPGKGSIRFYNISIWYNEKLTRNPKWSSSFYNDSCNNRAAVSAANDSVVISWNATSIAS